MFAGRDGISQRCYHACSGWARGDDFIGLRRIRVSLRDGACICQLSPSRDPIPSPATPSFARERWRGTCSAAVTRKPGTARSKRPRTSKERTFSGSRDATAEQVPHPQSLTKARLRGIRDGVSWYWRSVPIVGPPVARMICRPCSIPSASGSDPAAALTQVRPSP